MPLFNRIASVTIGQEGTQGIKINSKDFKISFDVKKTDTSSDPNFCKVELYNLNENTRGLITKEKQKIILKAGYSEGEGEEIIYTGDITSSNIINKIPNIVTVIEAGDGQKFLTEEYISVSYKSGISIDKVLKDIVSKISLPKKTNLNLISIKNKILNNGFSYNGPIKNVLDKLTDSLDLQWSIQNDELKIYNQDGSDLTQAIVIKQDTGMIGSPTKIKIKKAKKTIDNDTIDGWKVESLLQPKAEPGGTILLSSKYVGKNKQFRVINVNHNGDTIQKTFKTTLEVVEL